MTDRELLLAAILAHPDEDVPRLAYADEIEADEPARAEFVRVQCALARAVAERVAWDKGFTGGHACTDPACAVCPLRRRVRELWDALGAVLVPAGIGSVQTTFVRGFLEELEVSWEAWRDHGDAVVAAHPVRAVTLTTAQAAGVFRNRDGTTMRVDDLEDFSVWIHAYWPRIAFTLPPAGANWATAAFASRRASASAGVFDSGNG